jgi:hypothetical protein
MLVRRPASGTVLPARPADLASLATRQSPTYSIPFKRCGTYGTTKWRLYPSAVTEVKNKFVSHRE